MKIKYQAYALTEILVIMVVLTAMISLSIKPLRSIISEIPDSARVCRIQTKTDTILMQLKNDVEKSSRIVDFKANTLTLDQSGVSINYVLNDGQITRKPGLENQDTEDIWNLTDIRIEGSLWTQKGVPYALELTTWSRQESRGKEREAFRQSMVFFVKGSQE